MQIPFASVNHASKNPQNVKQQKEINVKSSHTVTRHLIRLGVQTLNGAHNHAALFGGRQLGSAQWHRDWERANGGWSDICCVETNEKEQIERAGGNNREAELATKTEQ